jgi:glycerophosphoryl diester phosphodiesterase
VAARASLLCLALLVIGCNWLEVTDSPASRKAVVIAHRGASSTAPEHTISAYDRAISAGADYLELDVQRTKDGVLVVVHDVTLDRTARGSSADCSGRVMDKTIAQIESCDVGAWFNSVYPSLARAEYVGLRVPRLGDVIVRYSATTRLYLETKDPESYPGIEADIVAALHQDGISTTPSDIPRVFVQSFSKSSLLRVRALDPTIPLVQVFDAMDPAAIAAQLSDVRSYAAAIGVPKQDVTPALMESAHARCLLVHAYVSDDPSEMQSLLAMGVDGIFTSNPNGLRPVIDSGPDAPTEERGCTVVAL